MTTITLTVPSGRTGQLQTEYGNYRIAGGLVTVDARLARKLIAAGFTSADITISVYDDGSMVTLELPESFLGEIQGYTIVDGQVIVPIETAWTLIEIGCLPVLTPLVSLDFKNGIYSINGVSKTLAECCVENLAWAVFSESASITPGVGLTSNGPVLSSEAQTGLLDGFVMVTEIITNNEFGSFYIADRLQLPGYEDSTYFYYYQGQASLWHNNDTELLLPLTGPGITRIAARLTANSITASIAGLPVFSLFHTSFTASDITFYIGPASVTVNEAIRSVKIYATSTYSNADLPALSTL